MHFGIGLAGILFPNYGEAVHAYFPPCFFMVFSKRKKRGLERERRGSLPYMGFKSFKNTRYGGFIGTFGRRKGKKLLAKEGYF